MTPEGTAAPSDVDPVVASLTEEFDLAMCEAESETVARTTAFKFLRALRAVEARIQANDDELKSTIEYLRENNVLRNEPLAAQVDYLMYQLEELFSFIPTGKRRSVNILGGGTMGTRAIGPNVSIFDNAKALADCQRVGAIRIVEKEAIDKKKLNKAVLEDGLVVDGTQVVPAHTSFYAKPEAPNEVE